MISFSGVVRLTRLEQSKSLHGEHLEQLNLSQLLKSVISWKNNIVTPCLKWYIHVICIYLLRQMSSQEFPKLCPPKLLKFILQMLILDNISVISRFFLFLFMSTLVPSDWMWNQPSSCLWPCCCDKQLDTSLGEYLATFILKKTDYTYT